MVTYSIADSPFDLDRYTEGQNVARIASQVQALWNNSHGQAGLEAGFRLVQAGFLFRSALMGIRMAAAAGTPPGDDLKGLLGDPEDQLLAFAGAKEAITGLVASLDLAGAAVYRLYFGAPNTRKPDWEQDIDAFLQDSTHRSQLPQGERDWLDDMDSAPEMPRIRTLRHMFTHRYFPRHLTIGATFDHQVDFDGRRERLGDVAEEFRAFVVDRLVALSLIYVVGITDIGNLLGISRPQADQLTQTQGFPAPAAVLSAGRIWRRADVEAWARETGRLS